MPCSAGSGSRFTSTTWPSGCSEDSLLYPFALSMIGLAIIGAGLLLHRHGAALERALQSRLPRALTAFRPTHAR